jgi:2-amino-4-hydroxy-6-hydroxymethyldihydropteridine diphosphokinase
MSEIVYISLGSNLGDRRALLMQARQAIGRIEGVELLGETAVEETEAIGPVEQGPFLNQMVSVASDLSPRALLTALQRIETAAGRVRTVRWGPRTLDLDIVLVDGVEYSDNSLTVPHPELPNRNFWLRQLAELRGVSDG